MVNVTEIIELPAREIALTLTERFTNAGTASDLFLNFFADQVLGDASGYPRVASLWTHQLSNQSTSRSGCTGGSKNTCRHRIQVKTSTQGSKNTCRHRIQVNTSTWGSKNMCRHRIQVNTSTLGSKNMCHHRIQVNTSTRGSKICVATEHR